MRETLFISDLHLDANSADGLKHFQDFIKGRAVNASALYILGDLFDAWIGDDQPVNELQTAFNALQTLSNNGTAIYFMVGNRDFLLSHTTAQKMGMTIINEPHLINIGEHPFLLLHGDTLCTDDTAYQEFRQVVRSKQWQSEFLAQSLEQRIKIANNLRAKSQQATAEKNDEIMDVNPAEVSQIMEKHAVHYLIHGHTHKPAIHETVDNLNETNKQTRIVLGDWHGGISYLSIKDKQLELVDHRVQKKIILD